MAINSKAAVENEYATKRTAILAYTDEQIDLELDSLVKFADKLRELVILLKAKEAINNQPVNTMAVGKISEAADFIGGSPASIRNQFKLVKELLADPVPPAPIG